MTWIGQRSLPQNASRTVRLELRLSGRTLHIPTRQRCQVLHSNSRDARSLSRHRLVQHATPPPGVLCRAATVEAGSVPVPVPTETVTPDGEQAKERYSWQKQWWPVAVLADLELAPRHNLQLLGRRLHLWRDLEGNWRCFQDRCPHRGAALSLGTITPKGHLECIGHARQFRPDGSCAKIFQIGDPEHHSVAVSDPSGCATAHPVMEADGLLWVWGEGGATAALEAATKSPNLLQHVNPCTAELATRKSTIWYCRDIPLRWSTMMEAYLDPSRFLAQKKMAMDVVQVEGGNATLQCEFGTAMGSFGAAFHAPGMISLDLSKTGFFTAVHVTPTAPGNCRFLMATWSDGQASSEYIRRYRENEADPLKNHTVLRTPQSDVYIGAAATMEANAATNITTTTNGATADPTNGTKPPNTTNRATATLPPTTNQTSLTADLLPALFRTWLSAVGLPPADTAPNTASNVVIPPTPQRVRRPTLWDKLVKAFLPDAPSQSQLPHEHLLDRYKQHVQHCATCSKALEAVQKQLSLATVLLPTTLLLAAASYPLHHLLPLPLAAAAAALAYWRARLLEQRAQFFYNPLPEQFKLF